MGAADPEMAGSGFADNLRRKYRPILTVKYKADYISSLNPYLLPPAGGKKSHMPALFKIPFKQL